MKKISPRAFCLLAAASLAGLMPAAFAQTTATNYFMLFQISANNTSLAWEGCNSTDQATSCGNSTSLGSFGDVCAVTHRDTYVYVADSASLVNGGATGPMTVYVYQQVLGASPSLTLINQIALPTSANLSAKCSMAATPEYLYVGTSTTAPYSINRSTYAVAQVWTINPGAPALSMSVSGSDVLMVQGGEILTIIGDAESGLSAYGDIGTDFVGFAVNNSTFLPPTTD
jgi:hypothetical protein